MENRITPVTQTGRAFKYQFDLEIQRVFLEIPFPCVVEVSWRRGNKSIQTKNKIDLQGQEKHFDVGEKMSMISTCYLDDNTHRFSEKNVHSCANIVNAEHHNLHKQRPQVRRVLSSGPQPSA